jgi:hypothetical protein
MLADHFGDASGVLAALDLDRWPPPQQASLVTSFSTPADSCMSSAHRATASIDNGHCPP